MESKKQTAVEWLALYIKGITNLNCDEVIDQAKAMEKQQIKEAYRYGESNNFYRTEISAKDYYTSTYE
jgi:hypothetical protein